MKEVADLHRKAMELADSADLATREGDLVRAAMLNRQALEHEKQAAAAIAGHHEMEPTRSVLHRSAASLAVACREYREAERLIATALATDPPDEIAEELRDLLEDVYFQRHLALRGVVLQPDEFQMSFAGNAVGFGIAPTAEVLARVTDAENLVYRTAERRLGQEYRERGRRKKALSDELELYVSVPRAASFAVTFRIGHNQLKLPSLGMGPEVVRSLLNCMDMLERGNMASLREAIPDEAYYNNFVGLAARLAPDGDRIRSVGFTTSDAGGERTVSLTIPRQHIPKPAPPQPQTADREPHEIGGTLLEADATSTRQGQILIVEKTGAQHTIRVPRGMMSDVVRPYFDELVVVTVAYEGHVPILQTIDSLTADENG